MIRLGNKFSKVNHRFIFCCNLVIFCVVYFGDTLVPIIFRSQCAKWSVTGDRAIAEWPTIQCINIWLDVFLIFFWLFNVAIWTENFWYFIAVLRSWSCYFEHFLYWLQFLRSLNSLELFVFIFHVSLFYGTRAISLSLHCVFRGRGVTVFLSFRGFRFSRCRAGEWANDKIPYHGERLHLSL